MTVRELGKMSALALATVLVLAACSDGTSRDERIGQLEEDADLPEEVRAEGIAAFMEAVPGVTEEQASCMVDGLVDELGADGVAALVDPAALDDRTTELITELTSTCGLGGDTLGGG